MEKDRLQRYIEELQKVVRKNQEYIDKAADEFQKMFIEASHGSRGFAPFIQSIRNQYREISSRTVEIASIQGLLKGKYRQFAGKERLRDRFRDRNIAERVLFVKSLYSKFERECTASKADGDVTGTAIGESVRPPAEKWLRTGEGAVDFTKNIRLLDELEYETTGPPEKATGAAQSSPAPVRLVQKSGRGFTLFSLRGPAAALDAFMPGIRLGEHDVIERFSAAEIRGVLTHLRSVTNDDVTFIFIRLLADRFRDVKCLLVSIEAPDDISEGLIKSLERAEENMQPGDIRMVGPAAFRSIKPDE